METQNDIILKEIKDTKKDHDRYHSTLVEIENIGYQFQESSGNSIDLDDLIEIKNHCFIVRQILNRIYDNKIQWLTNSLHK